MTGYSTAGKGILISGTVFTTLAMLIKLYCIWVIDPLKNDNWIKILYTIDVALFLGILLLVLGTGLLVINIHRIYVED